MKASSVHFLSLDLEIHIIIYYFYKQITPYLKVGNKACQKQIMRGSQRLSLSFLAQGNQS